MNLSIAVVGAGGLAVTAAWELAEKLGNRYEIKIYDHDKIELSNLNRQILFCPADVGKKKAEVLVARLSEKYPQAALRAFPFTIDQNNIASELEDCCAILDATDSARTSFLLNDYCVKTLKIFSYAGVVGVYGQSILVNPAMLSPCLRCVFGDWQEQDFEEIELTCQAAGIIGPVAGYLGTIQAQQIITALNFEQKQNQLIKISLNNLEPQIIDIHTSKQCCNACATKKVDMVNLSEKECPQTFILSKLALERSNPNTNVLFAFKTQQNALKTMTSLKAEGKVVNWLGDDKNKFWILSCN